MEERQLHKPVGARVQEGVCVVGEVQSPPGNPLDGKNGALTQAGIYTLSHFSNITAINKLKLLRP